MDAGPGPDVGEEFTTADNISAGDLVYWERARDGTRFLRRLDEWQVAGSPGPVWRIEPGKDQASFRLRQVKAGADGPGSS